MASFFFEGSEVIDGVTRKRVFEVAGVSTLEDAQAEIKKFHPNATDVRQVKAQSEGVMSTNPPRVTGPADTTPGTATGAPATPGRLGSVAPATVEQPPNQPPAATTPTDPNLRNK